MKKLMIALAVLSAVSAAHAGNNDHNLQGVYDQNGLKRASAYDQKQDGVTQAINSKVDTALSNTQLLRDEALRNKSEDDAQWHSIAVADGKGQQALDAIKNMPTPKDGVDGKDGKYGVDGKDGLNGTNGVDGLNGKDGKDGTNGVDGRDGIDGKNGADGKDGRDGAKGDKGDTGAAGINGTDGKDGLNGKDADMTAVNTNTAGVKSLQQRAADLDIRIAQQKADQAKTNSTVAGHTRQLADHEQRISTLESQTNSRFSDLDKRIDDNKRNADAGIAGVAAMANIPQVTDSQTFAVGAGVGTREGESAIAVGFSARASQNVVLKASVAGDTQQSWTVGAGVSYGW